MRILLAYFVALIVFLALDALASAVAEKLVRACARSAQRFNSVAWNSMCSCMKLCTK